MSDLTNLRAEENLRRAWRWIRSNPDANYKSYFRPLYQHYAVAEESLLADLTDRLKRNVYEPAQACKLFLPKASGILRPLSLLSVEDQIAYQAAVNVVAEKLLPKVRKRYLTEVFGHLYAGKQSVWFYKKWSNGYKAFNDAARKAFNEGFVYTASFDLTACYDSLDHGVLRFFLKKLGLDNEFSTTLTSWLERWTATEKGIYHGHGIPQGPLSSGLLSEVVLSHFDALKLSGVEFRYMRYVDDIRMFAKNEHDLRRLLVSLDLMSKDIGLFPQSGKIGIHRVANIETELKSVSNPPEPSIKRKVVNQRKLQQRLVEMSPRFRIQDNTRFKYLLAHAEPNASVTNRLWKILDNHPEIYRNVANYLRRYEKLPRIAADKLVDVIRSNNLYQSVRAEFLSAADGRLPKSQEDTLAIFVKKHVWSPKSLHADLLVASAKCLIKTGNLTPNAIVYACRAAQSWWARAMLIESVDLTAMGSTGITSIVMNGVTDVVNDPALSAAWKGFQAEFITPGRRQNWNKAAELLLREVGLIARSTVSHCGVSNAFRKLDNRICVLNWRRLFGSRFAQAERQAVELVSAHGVNISNFINLLDVFNDLLIDAVFRVDGTIGNYDLGKIGSVLNAPTGRFATKFPATFAYAATVHDYRYQSLASHPLIKRTGKPTKRIGYAVLPLVKQLLVASINELSEGKLV